MSRRKEYSIAFVLFFLLVFALLLATGTITSGWHLVDDHEYVEYLLQMKAPGGSLLSCMGDVYITVKMVLPQISVFAFKHCHVYSIIIVILYRRLLDDGIRQ